MNRTWPAASTGVRVLFPVGFLASAATKGYSSNFNTWHPKGMSPKGGQGHFALTIE